MSTADFHAAATTMIANLRTAAIASPHAWQKDAIQSPLGALVVVEYIAGVNEAFRVNGGAPICTHWQGASPIKSVMTAAGYALRK